MHDPEGDRGSRQDELRRKIRQAAIDPEFLKCGAARDHQHKQRTLPTLINCNKKKPE